MCLESLSSIQKKKENRCEKRSIRNVGRPSILCEEAPADLSQVYRHGVDTHRKSEDMKERRRINLLEVVWTKTPSVLRTQAPSPHPPHACGRGGYTLLLVRGSGKRFFPGQESFDLPCYLPIRREHDRSHYTRDETGERRDFLLSLQPACCLMKKKTSPLVSELLAFCSFCCFLPLLLASPITLLFFFFLPGVFNFHFSGHSPPRSPGETKKKTTGQTPPEDRHISPGSIFF